MRATTTHETMRGPDGIGEWTTDGGLKLKFYEISSNQ